MSADPSVRPERGLSSLAQAGRINLWQSNPERMAWLILLAAFASFVVISVSLPLTVRYVLRYATVAEQVQFTPTLGTILLYPARAEEPIAITGPRDDIGERSRIVTSGAATQGVLELSLLPNDDQALGTVHLYPGTTLEIERLRRPRFAGSLEPYTVRLRLDEGQIRLFTNSPDQRGLAVTVITPHGEAFLSQGSYNFSVTGERSDVAVRQGEAQITHLSGETLTITAGLRSWMTGEQSPIIPISAERNLINNGDFNRLLTETWQPYTKAEENVVPGKVEIVVQDGRRVAQFIRRGEENVHTEVGIIQAINEDVNGQDSLRVKLDVKLLYQSLAGAGHLSSEFPLRIEIDYTDIYGKDLRWGHGFYYRDPLAGWPLTGGEQILPFVWFSYESPNLMTLLADTRPSQVNSIRVYASGWNYEAVMSEIGLIVE
jgi:hypothetical protein